jgi:hypothetical protein
MSVLPKPSELSSRRFGKTSSARIDAGLSLKPRFRLDVQGVAALRRADVGDVALVCRDAQRGHGALADAHFHHAIELDAHHAGIDGAHFQQAGLGGHAARQAQCRQQQQRQLQCLFM